MKMSKTIQLSPRRKHHKQFSVIDIRSHQFYMQNISNSIK